VLYSFLPSFLTPEVEKNQSILDPSNVS